MTDSQDTQPEVSLASLEAQAKLDELARRLAIREGLDLLEPEATPDETPPEQQDLEPPLPAEGLTEGPASLLEDLAAFVNDHVADGETDLDALKNRIVDLAAEISEHHNKVLETSDFDAFASVPVGDAALVDLRPEEIEALVMQYKQDGNFEAAQLLADHYAQFMRVLNQKAIEGHLFQQKTAAYQKLNNELEWKEVEQAFVSRFPELKPHANTIAAYIDAQLQSQTANPLLPFTNKFVVVRDAIQALGLGEKLEQARPPVSTQLPPDATLSARKVDSPVSDGKKKYRMSDLKKMDYRQVSPEMLSDLQHAMFEDRILMD